MVDRAVYPGTFDPITLGHLDLIVRSAEIFDELTVAVAASSSKPGAMFSLEERMQMIREAADEAGVKIKVDVLDTLLVDFCRDHGIRVIIRGLRAYSDFENEFQMSLANRKLAPEVETMFLMPQEEHSYVTASTVREIARYGASTASFVPKAVLPHIDRLLRDNPALRLRAERAKSNVR